MLTQADRRRQYKVIERQRQIRINNVRDLRERFGGWRPLARRLGINDSFLVQIAGPNPTRDIGEKTVRGFEVTLGLPQGWFDQGRTPQEVATVPSQDDAP